MNTPLCSAIQVNSSTNTSFVFALMTTGVFNQNVASYFPSSSCWGTNNLPLKFTYAEQACSAIKSSLSSSIHLTSPVPDLPGQRHPAVKETSLTANQLHPIFYCWKAGTEVFQPFQFGHNLQSFVSIWSQSRVFISTIDLAHSLWVVDSVNFCFYAFK